MPPCLQAADANPAAAAADVLPASAAVYKLYIIQEYCDMGSLKDALREWDRVPGRQVDRGKVSAVSSRWRAG